MKVPFVQPENETRLLNSIRKFSQNEKTVKNLQEQSAKLSVILSQKTAIQGKDNWITFLKKRFVTPLTAEFRKIEDEMNLQAKLAQELEQILLVPFLKKLRIELPKK